MAVRPDWTALAAFESAARHQNFAHAAEELHLTASAVSHHVRKLESRLGVTLFRRHARGVTLTAEGRLLADAAGGAMTDMESVLRALRAGKDEKSRVRITTLHSLAYAWLTPRLPRFAALHPDVHLVFDTEVALTRFEEGGPDLGLRHGPGHWPGLSAHALMDDQIVPVAASDFPGVAGLREAADIARLPLISDLSRQGWHEWFRHAGVHGARLDERYSWADSTDALNAAAYGLGATLARVRVAAPFLAAGRVVRLPGPAMPSRWSYWIIHPTHRRLRPPARAFLDWLLEDVRRFGADSHAIPPAGAAVRQTRKARS
jgi:LysR family transcriptional regulator, glycine cleavage system transcriptional activator